MVYFYIVSVSPHYNGGIYYDFIGYDESGNKCCYRLLNTSVYFMMMKPPGMEECEFKHWLQAYVTDVDKFKQIITTYEQRIDAQFFNFNRPMLYAKFTSQHPMLLNTLYKRLNHELLMWYASRGISFTNRDINSVPLSDYDKLILSNIESPFRYASCSTHVQQCKYMLPGMYNIPLVGLVEINNAMTDSGCNTCLPRHMTTYYITANNIRKSDENINLHKYIRILSYDIEAYTSTGEFTNAQVRDDEVISIGVSLFTINERKPYMQVCFTTKDVCSNISGDADGMIKYKYSDERVDYYVCKDEKNMLMIYFAFIKSAGPDIITAFNNYEYDDQYIYTRCSMHYKIETLMLDAYTVYDINELSSYDRPSWQQIKLKMDCAINMNNYSVKSDTVLSTDIRKIIMKEDAKTFSMYGKSGLNTMLEQYNVIDPYTDDLACKDDMPYEDMFRYWREGDPQKIYLVNKYCAQDAMITGVLAVHKAKFIDYIEMAILTGTTISDSIYRADTLRVGKAVLSYAQKMKFAFMDFVPDNRSELIKMQTLTIPTVDADDINMYDIDEINMNADILLASSQIMPDSMASPTLGYKKYSPDIIKGGQVRNKAAGKNFFVEASDFSSMYPSQKEASNIDTSSRVCDEFINNPDKYGLKIISRTTIHDLYSLDGTREQIVIETNEWNQIPTEMCDPKIFTIELPQGYKVCNDKLYCNRYIIDQFLYEYKNCKPQKIYFVQSPKDNFETYIGDNYTKLPLIHYSLKEHMLSDLRASRKVVKTELEHVVDMIDRHEGNININKNEMLRLKAKELAIKVVMNSEYGATGYAMFECYDPDIGAAVTMASRICINQLKHMLDSKYYIISMNALHSIQPWLDKMLTYDPTSCLMKV